MSRAAAQDAIDRFFSLKEPTVLAIRGDWGVGKTYLWNDIARSWSRRYHLKYYSYVSLFGIDSLAGLKEQIFQRSLPITEAGNTPTVESAIDNLYEAFAEANNTGWSWRWQLSLHKFLWKVKRKIQRWPRLAEFVGGTAPNLRLHPAISLSLSSLISSISFLAVRNKLICLDDLERKGKNLRAADILGLVAELKEQRGCSVVLLLNEDTFQGEIAEDYAAYRDKVIDVHITCSPTPRECVELVLPDHPHKEQIANCVAKLNVTNMRVIKRCARSLDALSGQLQNLEDKVVEEVVQSIVLFCWCWFHRREGVPSLDMVVESGKNYFIFAREPEQLTDEERKIREVATSYGYTHTSKLDVQLAEYVKHGHFDPKTLEVTLMEQNNEAQLQRSGKSFMNIFEQHYYGQFGNNEQEFVDAMKRFWGEHGRNVSAHDLQQVVVLLRQLDRHDDANTIVEMFIGINRDRPHIFDATHYHTFQELSDPYILQRFSEEFEPTVDPRSVFDVMLHIARDSGWGRADIELLNQQSSDDFYRLFHETKHPDLFRVIASLLRLSRNGPLEWKLIADNIQTALGRINDESTMDHVRIMNLLGASFRDPVSDSTFEEE